MPFEVYCRECDWHPDPVDLKGEANLLAGKHISETGHSVALKEVEAREPDEDFVRSSRGDGGIEFLWSSSADPLDPSRPTERRDCGPIECLVETIRPESRPT